MNLKSVGSGGTRWNSRISAPSYLEQFRQEIPEISSRWKVELGPDSLLTVELPNRVSVRLSCAQEELGSDEPRETQTTLLWKHSLAIMPRVVASGGITHAANILAAYAKFLRSERWAELSASMTSLDHCIATRIRMLCDLRATCAALGHDLPEPGTEILRSDLEWAEDASRYRDNNHGLMLAIATMHAAEIYPEMTPSSVLRLGRDRLESIARAAFDDSWVCVENTPEYQGFYIRLCENALNFLEASGQSRDPLTLTLREIIREASSTLSRMLLPSGEYPAIGDSSGRRKSQIASVDGTVYSPHTGFYVHKEDGVYFSFKCGYASFVHKQMDDTSLTLQVEGEDLILDGGLHNYDWRDPFTTAVKSQIGHSGFFLRQYDELYPSSMYHPERYRIRSQLKRLSASKSGTQLSGRVIIDDMYALVRLVCHSNGVISIVDRHWGLGERSIPSDPVQRFLVPASLVERVTRPGLVRYGGERAWMEIEFDPESKVSTAIGQAGESPKGWISRDWSSVEPCRVLEIEPPAVGAACRATIRYGKLDATPAGVEGATVSPSLEFL